MAVPRLNRLVTLVSGGGEIQRPVLRRRTAGGWRERETTVNGRILTGWETSDQFPPDVNDYHRPASAADWLAATRFMSATLVPPTAGLIGFFYPPEGPDGRFPAPADVIADGGHVYLLNDEGGIVIRFSVGPLTPIVDVAGQVTLRYGVQLRPVSTVLEAANFPITDSTRLNLGFGSELESIIPANRTERVWANVNEQAETVGTLTIGEAESDVITEGAVITCRYSESRQYGRTITDDRGKIWKVTDSEPAPDLRSIAYTCERNIRVVE